MTEKKKLFGRGVYGSKDVPIRILDGFIIGAVALVVILVFWFATHGGYVVTFDTDGGTEVAEQKLKHGENAKEPEAPVKPGYEFKGWITSEDPSLAEEWNFAENLVQNDVTLYAVWEPAQIAAPVKPGYEFKGWITSEDPSLAEEWNFAENLVQNDVTLYAVWEPAQIAVKFDPDGGSVDGSAVIPDKLVTFSEPYGELPVPEKEGSRFDGWIYSGSVISADTPVTMTGEHVLTARWIEEET